jgi:hypothetical protein
LSLEDAIDAHDPSRVPLVAYSLLVVRARQSHLSPTVDQVVDRVPAGALCRLVREHLATQLVESPSLRGQGERVVRSDRLDAEKAPHPVLDRDRLRLDEPPQKLTRGLFELSAVGTLGILEEHELARRTVAPDQYPSALGVSGRDRSGVWMLHHALTSGRLRYRFAPAAPPSDLALHDR